MFEHSDQAITNFEGVTESRINSQLCKGMNMTTRHMRARRAPRMATFHDMIKETIRAHLTLVHVFHPNASADNPCVAHELSLLGIHEVW
jgi:hypothetical protein